MELKRVVVTGLGAITPIGNDVETTWLNAVAGKSGAAPITHFDASQFKTQFACEVKDFNPNDHFDRKKLRQLDLYAQYAMVAARQAVADSGIEEAANLDRNRVGVIVAAGIGGLHTFEEEAGYYALNGPQQGPKYNPFFIPKMIADIASGHISMEYNYHGPNFGVVSACASSNNAIIDAFNLIRLGKADVFVTGGAEAAIYPAGVGGFNSMHALSTRNDDPEHASRPFSASRDGFVMGEGAGALVLEEYEHALRRGAHIYCEVAGGGMSADAYHMTAPHPEGAGAIRSMREALDDASAAIDDIDYINVHGTSTPLGDIAELKALSELFGERLYDVNISSTKSMTGHLLGAAAAIEAIACVMAIVRETIPPTINVERLDERIDPRLNLTLGRAQHRRVRCALSNTFGFGGHNSTVIFRKVSQQ